LILFDYAAQKLLSAAEKGHFSNFVFVETKVTKGLKRILLTLVP
jgi:hypothetical protein